MPPPTACPQRNQPNQPAATSDLCNREVNDELANALLRWDVEYDCVYMCWLSGGDYERWAADELENRRSRLNETGIAVACRLSVALACPVQYFQHVREP